jgi:hypothetical protein
MIEREMISGGKLNEAGILLKRDQRVCYRDRASERKKASKSPMTTRRESLNDAIHSWKVRFFSHHAIAP